MEKYATEVLGMTADTNLNDGDTQLNLDELSKTSPLRMQFHQCTDVNNNERHLCQDAMYHTCNDYCLGPKTNKGEKCRSCRSGFGKEANANQGDIPGKDLIKKAIITRDHKGVECLALARTHSKRVMQHSKFLLQG